MFHEQVPLVPPGRYSRLSGCHWVQWVNSDGQSQGLEVYQWQPQAQKWCRVNQAGSGPEAHRDLVGYQWIAVCPFPPFPNEVLATKSVLARLDQLVNRGVQTVSLSKVEYEDLSRLIREQILGVW